MPRKIIILLSLLIVFIASIFIPEPLLGANEYSYSGARVYVDIKTDGTATVNENLTLEFGDQPDKIVRKIPKKISLFDIEGDLSPRDITLSVKDTPPVKFQIKNNKDYIDVILDKNEADLGRSREIKISYTVDLVLTEEKKEYFVYLLKGSATNTTFKWAQLEVTSLDGRIIDSSCFAGNIGNAQRSCVFEFDKGKSIIKSSTILDDSKDFAGTVLLKEKDENEALNNKLLYRSLKKNIFSIVVLSAVLAGAVVFIKRKIAGKRLSVRIKWKDQN